MRVAGERPGREGETQTREVRSASMNRRGLIGVLLLAGSGILQGSRAKAGDARASKAVYHLADADKVAFVLGNVHNHLIGAGGSGAVKLAVVVHGPALRL